MKRNEHAELKGDLMVYIQEGQKLCVVPRMDDCVKSKVIFEPLILVFNIYGLPRIIMMESIRIPIKLTMSVIR